MNAENILVSDEVWTEISTLQSGINWFGSEIEESGTYKLEWSEGYQGTVTVYQNNMGTVISTTGSGNFRTMELTGTSNPKTNYFFKLNATYELNNFKIKIYKVEDINTGLTVHFKKPASWSKVYLHYWNVVPAQAQTSWPGVEMTDEGNDWFVYTITDATSASVIFNNMGSPQTADLSRTGEGWYKEGAWYDFDPEGPVPPAVSASPSGGDFWISPITVTLSVSGDDLTVVKYTLDGSDPVSSGTAVTYTNGNTISIGNGMNIGDSKTLRLYATNGTESDTATYTFNKVDTPAASAFSWDNALVYFVIPDRFYNGNTANDNSYGRVQVDATGKNIGTFHGGDLAGMTQKLNEGYFTNLGINAIWITAPYEQIHGWCGGGSNGDFAHYAYHGYYTLDYTMMDQNMGTIDELRTFVDTAHSMNIRIIFDIVMNHAGYNTLKDMVQYGFGKANSGTLDANWTPSGGQTWHSVHDLINYNDSASWANWWMGTGGSWIRAGIAGYTAPGGDDLTQNLAGLPDFRTELTNSIGLAKILQTKWQAEATGFDDWKNPSASTLRSDIGVSPADYIVKWLAAWVAEFGIDGFRVDTAKHVEKSRWAQLKTEANAKLASWRLANPTKPGATWTDNFWMTAEVWDHGANKSDYHTTANFDSVINFGFPKDGNLGSIGNTWQSYANSINSDPSWNALHYISSHDTALSRSNPKNLGTALVLSPGGVQIFYGDESARPFGDTGSDPYQGTRSDMNWGQNADILSHWQKLGQFRNRHLSVGAGSQTAIASNVYGRIYNSDKVVIAINQSGTVSVPVTGIFNDGDLVKNAYDGTTATVTSGAVSFSAGANGVILIELAN